MLRGTGLSVSDPGVAEAVDPAGTELAEREAMFGRAVPAITPEAVAGVGLGEGAHRVIADDLGHDTRGGDCRAVRIGPGQALHLGTQRKVAVSKAAPGVRVQGGEGPGQGLAVSQANAVAIYPPGRVRYDGDGLGPAKQRAEDSLPEIGPQQFGVVDPGDLTSAKYDGRCHQRPRQRAAAGLIGPG